MKIVVYVKTNSKLEKVEPVGKNEYKIYVSKSPVKGQANVAMVRLLADYFNLPKSSVSLTRGAKSKKKIFEISD